MLRICFFLYYILFVIKEKEPPCQVFRSHTAKMFYFYLILYQINNNSHYQNNSDTTKKKTKFLAISYWMFRQNTIK